ncbi:ACP S-malonyltransferase [Micromonospora sp. WMMD1120]|uniref:ACP S-malonyltransferase n=1 Tax=Micromonospora sp. WMMD1120 TaxID=3016106 RepID=UPI002417C978|nr:ACP S-malonyltransferase [Micromonospora sp. WMMD1120]MDG4810847.1 ACP S-malonyltransferase [Micromonospora sp. WMMD1120]
MIAYVFPGQGSQSVGMGAGLFEEFAELTAEADRILGYSVAELCAADPHGRLGQTRFTQPALYVVNALCHLHKLTSTGRAPDYVAGHSVGEYNALFAAGVFDFGAGLRLVARRGELMGMARGGGMAAVLGLPADEVAAALAAAGLDGVDLANLNTPTQVVLSGLRADIERAAPVLKAAGARGYTVLNVSGAFHSRYMRDAAESFAETLSTVPMSPPRIPVIANVTARPYPAGQIADLLARQITAPVRWTETVRHLLDLGVTDIEQVGPGKVLTGLVRAIRRDVAPSAGDRPAPTPVAAPPTPVATRLPVADGRPADLEAAAWLGDAEFRRHYGLRYAYVSGSMYRGIASPALVIRMARAGMLGFLGTGGLRPRQIDDAIAEVRRALGPGQVFGVNLLHDPGDPAGEDEQVDRYLRHGVRLLEASAFMDVSMALVRYRCLGLRRDAQGRVVAEHRLMAKVSRPEVARAFLAPPPEQLLRRLVADGRITDDQARLAAEVPMADDLTVEADSAGHTDGGVAYTLMPALRRLRDDLAAEHGYQQRVRIGAAGGIGTPEAAAAALILGADYLVTGSINQCTVEAGTSEPVKDLLQQMGVQDTAYAPAGDMFEIGARVQVLRRGVFFPARANKLYQLYQQHDSLESIDAKTRQQIEQRYFKRSFDDVFDLVRQYKGGDWPAGERLTPKQRMLAVFKWYFAYTSELALRGDPAGRVDYQVHCGPALGAFNSWVQGTEVADWRHRHADEIGLRLLAATSALLTDRLTAYGPGAGRATVAGDLVLAAAEGSRS